MNSRLRLSSSAKIGIGVLIVLVALIVALVLGMDGVSGSGPAGTADGGDTGGGASASGTNGPQDAQGRASQPRPASGDRPLAGITLDRFDGSGSVDLGADLAGTPAVVNLWAYWCAPCREELPAMQAFAARAGSAVTVLTVHSDPRAGAGRELLDELGVDLPAVEDAEGKVATAVGAPPVLPVTVLLRPDGTVAHLAVRPFASADEIAQAVSQNLGVTA